MKKTEAGEWSEEAYFEMGLLSDEDWNAQWINPELSKLTTKEYDCSDAINAQAKRGMGNTEIEGASMKYISLQATCDVYSVHLRNNEKILYYLSRVI